ncbi:MAG: hypothetical protein E6767_07825 [Dysgonomonas sp.]|nr:hypothetical protein [Dysgonomonas sp.]
MKKLLFVLIAAITFTVSACSVVGQAYNTQLKQVELGMTQDEIISLMGDKYTVTDQRDYNNQTIVYKDRYKNYWNFQFVDGRLYKWYKETEE